MSTFDFDTTNFESFFEQEKRSILVAIQSNISINFFESFVSDSSFSSFVNLTSILRRKMKTQESRHVSVVETLNALKRKSSKNAKDNSSFKKDDRAKQRRRIDDSSRTREIHVDEIQMFDDRDDEDSISTNSSNVSKSLISQTSLSLRYQNDLDSKSELILIDLLKKLCCIKYFKRILNLKTRCDKFVKRCSICFDINKTCDKII